MSYSIRFFTGWLAAIGLTAVSLGAQAQGTVVLTGKVSGRTADTVAVSVRENPLEAKDQIVYARVDDKGEFRIAVPVQGPTKADLVYGDDVASMFLEPGNSLDVRFKGDAMASSLRFKANDVGGGKGKTLTPEQQRRVQAANANNYLVEADDKFVENDGFQVLPDNIMSYEPAFLSFLDYRRKQEQQFYKDSDDEGAFSPAFRKYAQAEIDYAYANDRLTFQDLREQVVATESRLKMTPTYYDFLNDKALINNANAVQSELYQEFLLNFIHHTALENKHQRTDPDFYKVCYDLAKSQLTGTAQAITMGRVLQESFRFGHVKQSAALLADFQKLDAANRFYPLLKEDFETHKAFAIGSPAPDFKLLSATGDTVSLRQFAGKLVYLNFWRSTSGLCLRDLPYAAELAKKFDGKNIVFLNIALDDNEGAWKQLVVSRKLAGMHVRAAGGIRAAVARAYGVQDVPAYFLLAEDGTFLNTKPKRLSSHAAQEEIRESFGKASTYTSLLPTTSKQ